MKRFSSQQRLSFQKFWQSSGFVIVIVSLLVLFLVALSKEIARTIEVNDQIASLQQEADALGSQNQDLSKLIAYLNTDARYEREARERLGLKKPNESVLVVPDRSGTGSSLTETDAQASSEISDPVGFFSRPVRWWEYFFPSR